MKKTEELRGELYAPLPSEAVKPHPTKTYLSSIKAIYVTDRLNEVFGIGKWRTKVECVERSENGMVVVKVTLEIPEYGIYYESFGGNDNGGENSKNFDLGDAYKGASTDAITKIGSYLGIGIHVFKGKAQAQGQPQQPEPESQLPWLSDKNLADMKSFIASGKKELVRERMKMYRIKKAFREELEELLK